MPSASQPVPAVAQPPHQTPTTRNERRSITGRMKIALDSMVFEGIAWDKAGPQAGLTVRTMRLAIERPHVIRYLRQQRDVFRASVCAGNISALAKLRADSGNAMAQLGAIKVLEQMGDDAQPGAAPKQAAGMVIVVVRQATDAVEINAPAGIKTIEHDPDGSGP